MIVFIAALCVGQPDLDAALSAAVKRSLDRAKPSVVRIDRAGSDAVATTGVVIDAEGRIATSAHSFARGASGMVVTFSNGEHAAATLLGIDDVLHVAFLRTEKKAPTISTAATESLKVGVYAVVVGRTLADSPTASLGIVSALGRVFGKAIQTDAKTSPTNYGGPLLDLEGRAFGVVVSLSAEDDAAAGADLYDSGIGFAIPMGDVLRSVERLKKGAIERGLLGFGWRDRTPLDGPLTIERLGWKSPAADAGLKVGDTINSINGIPVEYYSQFRTSIGKLYANDAVNVKVARSGKSIDATLKAVAKLPVYRRPFLGLTVEEKGPALAVISAVGPAANSGLQPNDRLVELDGPVKSRRDLESKLSAKVAGDAFALVVERGGKRQVVAVKSIRWPEALPAETAAANIAGKALVTEVPFPAKHWVVRSPSTPTALILVAGRAKPDRWQAASEKTGVVVVGAEERLPNELWKVLLPPIRRSMKLDAYRTAVVGSGGDVQALARELGADVGGVAVDGGSFSPPPAQPDEPVRWLAIRRRDGTSLVEGIKKARDDGLPVTEVEIGDPSSSEFAEAVSRWAVGLSRY